MHHAAMVQLFALGHMERGLQASAEDRAVGKDGGHIGNERGEEAGVGMGRGSTTLAFAATGTRAMLATCAWAPVASHACSSSSSWPGHALEVRCLRWREKKRREIRGKTNKVEKRKIEEYYR